MPKNQAVDDYIASKAIFAQEILIHLRTIIHAAEPEISETIKWRQPCFEHHGLVCAFAAFKKHVNFSFFKGKMLTDSAHIFAANDNNELIALKQKRRAHSQQLQDQLLQSYKFINSKGKQKTPKDLFEKPPAGAGECAAPKLLQYAFSNNLKPISMAEFWWGSPPNLNNGSPQRIHKKYYPACEDKCRGVLGWMLDLGSTN